MVCDAFDVVLVPFPFTGAPDTKRRPAVVLSRRQFNACGHCVLAMITSAQHSAWPGDVPIEHKQAGLALPSIIRLKFFTLDNRLILRRLGCLASDDRNHVCGSVLQYLDLAIA